MMSSRALRCTRTWKRFVSRDLVVCKNNCVQTEHLHNFHKGTHKECTKLNENNTIADCYLMTRQQTTYIGWTIIVVHYSTVDHNTINNK